MYKVKGIRDLVERPCVYVFVCVSVCVCVRMYHPAAMENLLAGSEALEEISLRPDRRASPVSLPGRWDGREGRREGGGKGGRE